MTAQPVVGVGAIVLDCADPRQLGEFYGAVLGRRVHPESNANWVELEGDEPVLAFQRVRRYQPPAWPHGAPQQAHLDLRVTDFTSAHRRVVALGATPLDPVDPPPAERERTYRVYADPAGHPFCLCRC